MIRQFRIEDAAACRRVIHDCLIHDMSISTTIRERLLDAETLASIEERGRLFYVAVHETDGCIDGLAGLDMNEIRILCVSPGRQGRGIGKSLVEHLLSMVPDIPFREIFVYSSRPAAGFYRSLGFVEKGPVAFDVEGEELETIFMTRSRSNDRRGE